MCHCVLFHNQNSIRSIRSFPGDKVIMHFCTTTFRNCTQQDISCVEQKKVYFRIDFNLKIFLTENHFSFINIWTVHVWLWKKKKWINGDNLEGMNQSKAEWIQNWMSPNLNEFINYYYFLDFLIIQLFFFILLNIM